MTPTSSKWRSALWVALLLLPALAPWATPAGATHATDHPLEITPASGTYNTTVTMQVVNATPGAVVTLHDGVDVVRSAIASQSGEAYFSDVVLNRVGAWTVASDGQTATFTVTAQLNFEVTLASYVVPARAADAPVPTVDLTVRAWGDDGSYPGLNGIPTAYVNVTGAVLEPVRTGVLSGDATGTYVLGITPTRGLGVVTAEVKWQGQTYTETFQTSDRSTVTSVDVAFVQAGATSPITVLVADAFGNLIPNANVTLAWWNRSTGEARDFEWMTGTGEAGKGQNGQYAFALTPGGEGAILVVARDRVHLNGAWVDRYAYAAVDVLPAQATENRTLHLRDGWNMVSVPVLPEDARVESVLPGVAAVWAWNGTRYEAPATLAPGRAYWVLALGARDVSVTGAPLANVTAHLHTGWNLVGGPSAAAGFQARPAGVEPTLWHWDGALYAESTGFQPGKGYWVLNTGPGVDVVIG